MGVSLLALAKSIYYELKQTINSLACTFELGVQMTRGLLNT